MTWLMASLARGSASPHPVVLHGLPHAESRHCGAVALVNQGDSAPNANRDQGTSFVGIPMESEQKNSYLFYLIITDIVLGFIASLALPLKAEQHHLSDAGLLNARDIP